jgi:hypothetical protein
MEQQKSNNRHWLYLITLIVIIAAFCFYMFSKREFDNPFKAKPILIDKTANVVEGINQLAEIATATYYQEIFINKIRKRTFFDDELVIITKGKVRAGFDLTSIKEDDITIDEDVIRIRLPKVKILDVITNPSDFETFVEIGRWSFSEVNEYKRETRQKLEENAIKGGILERAEASALTKLASFLHALGFVEIVIE